MEAVVAHLRSSETLRSASDTNNHPTCKVIYINFLSHFEVFKF